MNKKRIHYFQHVPYEGLGYMEKWFLSRGHTLSSTQFYNDAPLPGNDDFDWLIIMGGPMGVYDYDTCPWLYEEKRCIERALKSGKIILGICLGAQLIAEVLGASVTKNKNNETGWFPVTISENRKNHFAISDLPASLTVFHWHSDTFEIPYEAEKFASSEKCENQAFIYKERVIGIQFHMESQKEDIDFLIRNSNINGFSDTAVRQTDEMLSHNKNISVMNNYFGKFLSNIDLL